MSEKVECPACGSSNNKNILGGSKLAKTFFRIKKCSDCGKNYKASPWIKVFAGVLLFLVGVFILFVFGFYLYLIKIDRVDNPNYLHTCKIESENKVKIELATAASYITNYNSELEGDTLFVEIYTTLIGNVFNSSRDIRLKLPITKDIKYLRLCEKTYSIDNLSECRTESTNQSIEGVIKEIQE